MKFSPSLIRSLAASKILGIRVGREHRFTGVWVVVMNSRVFVRSWTNSPRGWYRSILKDRLGTIQIGKRTTRVRARITRSERLLDAIDQAYGEKYTTPASRKYVRGLARPQRRKNTVELMPLVVGPEKK